MSIAPGARGQFDIVVDGDVVAGKRSGVYPDDADAIDAVRTKLGL